MQKEYDGLTVHSQGINFDHDHLKNITNIKVAKHYGSIRTGENIKTVSPFKKYSNLLPLNFHLYALFVCGLFINISPKSLIFFHITPTFGDRYTSRFLFNIFRIISAPLMGYSCNYFGSLRVLLSISICLLVALSINYLTSSFDMLILATILFGIASNRLHYFPLKIYSKLICIYIFVFIIYLLISILVLRGFLIQKVNFNDRTSMMAFILSMQYLGTCLLPIIILSTQPHNEVYLTSLALLSTAFIIIISFYKFPHLGSMGQQQEYHNSINSSNPSMTHIYSVVELSPPLVYDNEITNKRIIPNETDDTLTYYLENNESNSDSNTTNATNTSAMLMSKSINYYQLVIGCLFFLATKVVVGAFEVKISQISKLSFGFGAAELGYILPMLGMTGLLPLLWSQRIAASLSDKSIMMRGVGIITVAILTISISSYYHLFIVNSNNVVFWIIVSSVYTLGYPLCCIGIGGMVSKATINGSQNTIQGWFACSEAFASVIMCYLTADTMTNFSYYELLSLAILISSGGMFLIKLLSLN